MGLVLLIVGCVGTFVAMTVRTRGQQLPGFSTETLEDWGGVTSSAGRTEAWRLVASAFVHVTGFHLLYNVGALTLLGFLLSGFTSITYAVLCFLVCAVGATRGSLSWEGRRRKRVTTVGASGGVCGLNAALIVFAACRGETDLRDGLAILLALTLAVGLLPGIDNVAHLAGACGGVVFGLLALPFGHHASIDLSAIPRNPTLLQRFGLIDQIVSGAIVVGLGYWLSRERKAARTSPARDPRLPPWRRQ